MRVAEVGWQKTAAKKEVAEKGGAKKGGKKGVAKKGWQKSNGKKGVAEVGVAEVGVAAVWVAEVGVAELAVAEVGVAEVSCSICTASQLAAPTDIFAKDHKKTTHSRERPRTPRAVHLLIPTVRGQRRKPKNLFFAKKALVAFFPRPISAFFNICKIL